MTARDIVLVLFGAGWLAALVITALRGEPLTELWPALPLTISALIIAFRASGRPPDDKGPSS